MIQEREELGSKTFGIIITVVSVLAFIGAFYITNWLSIATIEYNSQYLTVLLILIPLWHFGISKTNLTRFYRAKDTAIILIESFLFIFTIIRLICKLEDYGF